MTTLVHVSEISNILEAGMAMSDAVNVVSGLLDLDSLVVTEPVKRHYGAAVEEARVSMIGVNDALAWLTMKERDVSEIYSFDKDFDRLSVKRIQS